MNIETALAKMHSKKNSVEIADWIGNDPERFAKLVRVFLENEYRISQRSAMVLSHIHDRRPWLIRPYLPQLIGQLRRGDIHDAIKRNTVRILQDTEIPDALLGEAADICFDYLVNPAEAVAIRCFSMTVCWNICLRVPELMPELKAALEDWTEHGSAGFKSRSRKIMAAIARYEKKNRTS